MTAKEFETFRIKTLENQKFNADTISVSLSKKELELLIDKLSDMLITNKQAINIYQKPLLRLIKNLKLCRAKMNPDFEKSIKQIEENITLANFLSELNVSKNDRVVIYDDLENMVFDSDAPELFGYWEYWEMLEEGVCRVSDVTENGQRSIFIFMGY